MRARLWIPGLFLLAALFSSPVSAQHIADPASMQRAVTEARSVDDANRAAVLQALEREDVRMMADRLGLDLKEAASAVQALSGQELAELASPAGALNLEDPAGGQRTIVISLTTLLLILILVAVIAT